MNQKIIRPAEASVLVNADYVDLSHAQQYAKLVPVIARQIKTAFYIKTAEGTDEGGAGDWLVQGMTGARWVCKDAIFKQIYQPIGVGPVVASGVSGGADSEAAPPAPAPQLPTVH